MTQAFLRELDSWIDVHLFDGGKFVGLMKRGMWYRPHAKGYTNNPDEAGRYTREEAKKHEHLDSEEPVTIHELPVSHFSTSPAAIRVLNKCIMEGAQPLISRGYHVNGQMELFTIHNGEIGNSTASCDTLEVTICLFAKNIFSE